MKYKVGDRVRIVEEKVGTGWNWNGHMDKWLGKTMTINALDGRSYKMAEDRTENAGDGWYWGEHMIEGLADDRKIVITTDGKTTTARLFNGKELVKKAEAKCSPDDKFDFMVGAELAMDRLLDKKPKKPVNPFKVGDFVKIKSNKTLYHGFPVGSVGRVTKADDDGTCEVDGFYDNGIRGNQWVEIEELEKV